MNRTPCKDCRKREIGCHAVCEEYLAFREERTKICTELQARSRASLPQSSKKIKQINSFLKNRRH